MKPATLSPPELHRPIHQCPAEIQMHYATLVLGGGVGVGGGVGWGVAAREVELGDFHPCDV